MAVELTLVERSGIDRIDEPITFGVPLPQGHVHLVDQLFLAEGDRPVAAEMRPVDLWPDGSLRWIHIDFQSSVRAGGTRHLTLEQGVPPSISSRLVVEEDGGALTVTTGKVRVRMRASGFNVFDQVWAADGDGVYSRELVGSHRRGLVALIDGEEYVAANDVDALLAVESRGPMRLVLRAEDQPRSGRWPAARRPRRGRHPHPRSR